MTEKVNTTSIEKKVDTGLPETKLPQELQDKIDSAKALIKDDAFESLQKKTLDDYNKQKTTDKTKDDVTDKYKDEWNTLIKEKAKPEEINKLKEKVKEGLSKGEKLSDDFLKQIEIEQEKKEDKKEDEPYSFKSPFLKNTKKDKKDIVLNTLDDIKKYVKDNYNVEDINGVFELIDDLKTQNTTFSKDKEKLGYYEAFYNNMPEDLSSIFYTWANSPQSNSYKDVINNMVKNSAIDFSKDFTSHDFLKLLNHYFPDKYTKEDYEDLEDKEKDTISFSVKRFYDSDKEKTVKSGTSKKEYETSLQKKREALDTSVNRSVKYVKGIYPKLTPDNLNSIKDVLINGMNKELIGDDGYYKETAGESIAMMLFGKQTFLEANNFFEREMNKAVELSKSKENEKRLSQGNRNLNTGSSGKSLTEEEARKKFVEKETSFLKPKK